MKLVQQHLNLHLREIGLLQPLAVDGHAGPKTIEAITAFQSKLMHFPSMLPMVALTPTGNTWKALSGHGGAGPAPAASPIPKIGRPTNPVDLSTATINSTAETMIKHAEAKGGIPDLNAYVCPAGKLTIGWGTPAPM